MGGVTQDCLCMDLELFFFISAISVLSTHNQHGMNYSSTSELKLELDL